MAYRYAILDVFTDKPLAGNALAVLPDATGLDDDRMRAIAREFNLSETVFVFPPDNPLHSGRLRIFTPSSELPFAGHPTVGTAVLLARAKMTGAGPGRHEVVLVLEEKVGPIRCGVFLTGRPSGHAVFDVPRRPEVMESRLNAELLAAALGIAPTDIGFENHKPSIYTAGVAYSFVPVRDLAAIGRARPNAGAWDAAFGLGDHAAAYLYCRQTESAISQFHARMFWPNAGITEDPASGSAVAAFAGVLLHFDGLTSGSHRYIIEQGFEMKRPSIIKLEIDIVDGEIAAARIGGDVVVIAEGTLEI